MNTKRNIRHIILSIAMLATGVCTVQPVYAEGSANGPRVEVATVPTVRVVHGNVEITLAGDEHKQVQVFALTGQLVKSVTAAPGTTVIDLPAGYYIVKCDRLSQRVIVR